MRITETLSLEKFSFEVDCLDLFAEVKVLKKRDKEEFRAIRIHPIAVEFIKTFLESRLSGKVFRFSKRAAQRAVKSIFGIEELSTHSMRHSAVSYLLFEKDLWMKLNKHQSVKGQITQAQIMPLIL